MANVTVQRTIQRPLPEVWAALADFGGIYRFHPVVESSPLSEGSPPTGLGAERTCHFYDGNSLEERITAFEPAKHMVVEITRGSMPLKSGVGRFDVASVGGGTSVTMSMDFEPKYGLLGQLMAVVAMKPQFTKLLNKMLAALEDHLRTGELIDADWEPAVA